jgi:hypothetical protein
MFVLHVTREMLNKMLFYHFSCKRDILTCIAKNTKILFIAYFFSTSFFLFIFFKSMFFCLFFFLDYSSHTIDVMSLANSPELTRVIFLIDFFLISSFNIGLIENCSGCF